MYLERKEDLSVFQWLVTLFADAPFVHIVDAFPMGDLVIPTISVESQTINSQASELGNRTTIKLRTYTIDIFGQDKAQRDEYAYRIFDALDLETPLKIYDYALGFTNPPEIDSYDVLEKRLQNIRIYPQSSAKLYYRANVTFVAQKNSI